MKDFLNFRFFFLWIQQPLPWQFLALPFDDLILEFIELLEVECKLYMPENRFMEQVLEFEKILEVLLGLLNNLVLLEEVSILIIEIGIIIEALVANKFSIQLIEELYLPGII